MNLRRFLRRSNLEMENNSGIIVSRETLDISEKDRKEKEEEINYL